MIHPGQLLLAFHTINAIYDLKTALALTELKSFLNSCNVNERFVPSFARAVVLQKAKQKKKKEFIWFNILLTDEIDALGTSQHNSIASSVPALPRCKVYFTLNNDAFNNQTGSLLMRGHSNEARKALRYWTRTLNAIEQNYDRPHDAGRAVV